MTYLRSRSEISIAFFILTLVLAFYLVSLISLAVIRPDFDFSSSQINSFQEAWQNIEEIFRLYFTNTLKQASLSASIICIIGYGLAKALYYLPEKLKFYTLTITNSCFSLPVLLVVFAFISIGGKEGLINSLLSWLHIDYQISIYGLAGVLAANTYFNIGYSTTHFYNNLRKIPLEQVMMARQLSMTWWQQFRYIELPYLKSYIANLWLLMFMICFNSFALVLFLGGPSYNNFEVAIYRQLVTANNYSVALIIGCVQIGFSLLIILLLSLIKNGKTLSSSSLKVQEFSTSLSGLWFNTAHIKLKKIASYTFAILAILYVLIPLLDIIVRGLFALKRTLEFYFSSASKETFDLNNWTRQSASYDLDTLIQGTTTSFVIAICASILCLGITIFILRGFRWFSSEKQELINNLSLIGLAIPSMLLGAGYYMLFIIGVDFEMGTYALITLIIVANSVSSIPLTMNYLSPAYKQLNSYNNLAINLKLSSWQSLTIYELPLIKQSLVFAFLNIFTISMGDFSIILFFVSNDLTSITYILSKQLSSLYQNQGNITALFLLTIIFLIRFLSYFLLKNKRAIIKVEKEEVLV